MDKRTKQSGFSLTEVLLAVGVLAVGMMVVAGVYPAALYFATLSTEKTIASAVADEAFAKIQLYDVNNLGDLSSNECKPYRMLNTDQSIMYDDGSTPSELRIYERGSNEWFSEYVYPTDTAPISDKDYSWSAVCRWVDSSKVQVTVFVSRLVGAGDKYYWWDDDNELVETAAPLPEAVRIAVNATSVDDEIEIDNSLYYGFINRGSEIVDDETGIIYEVQERYKGGDSDIVRLDKDWYQGTSGTDYVWVVPPPEGGGRKPCIGVYQKIIKF